MRKLEEEFYSLPAEDIHQRYAGCFIKVNGEFVYVHQCLHGLDFPLLVYVGKKGENISCPTGALDVDLSVPPSGLYNIGPHLILANRNTNKTVIAYKRGFGRHRYSFVFPLASLLGSFVLDDGTNCLSYIVTKITKLYPGRYEPVLEDVESFFNPVYPSLSEAVKEFFYVKRRKAIALSKNFWICPSYYNDKILLLSLDNLLCEIDPTSLKVSKILLPSFEQEIKDFYRE